MQADGRVALHNVTVRYGRRVALEAVSGEFSAGSLTAVVGANGAGKSTLLAAIAGVVRLAGGTVNCAARQRLAYLPQLASIDRDYPLTVAELIALGGWRQFGAFRSPGATLRARAAVVAETVGLAGRLKQPIAGFRWASSSGPYLHGWYCRMPRSFCSTSRLLRSMRRPCRYCLIR
jgi:zinc/manganese transport system ATP-binding protein